MMSLHGILPALVTPFDAEERFCAKPFELLLNRVYRAGVHGVYVCGQTGEGLLQPLEQRKRVAEVAVRNSPPGKQVIIHTGCYRTADALELTRHAAKIGATAVSALPPPGSYSFSEIREYYEALACVVGLPVLVYYFPEVCPGITTVDQILELADIPNVAGLKFTDYDLYVLSILKKAGHAVFNGRDEVLTAGMLMGADGGIGTFYNLVPKWFVQVFDLCHAGRYCEARAVQERINRLIRLTLRFPLFAAVKRMLDWSGIDCGPVLRPRRELTPEEDDALRRSLLQAGFDPSDVSATLTPKDIS